MKIVHTADWHLGKLVQGVYMTEDQRYILEQFLEQVKVEKPDVIVIAGDIYDRSIPPTEAISLFDELLKKISIDEQIPLIAIAGNHDSASRIDFGSTLMASSGVYLIGKWHLDAQPIRLFDEEGPVDFWPIPYMDPSEVRALFNDDNIRSHQQAMQKIVEHIEAKKDAKARNVFIGHAFVTNGGVEEEKDSEGERPLAIGGSECIDAALFEKFDYAAFGHLHGAHFVMNERIRYAGSPLKYSISEERHQKGYLSISLTHELCDVEKKPLTPLRQMRSIEMYLEDLLQLERNEDYVFVTLLDEQPVLSPMEKVRQVFPNAMHVSRKMIVHDREQQLHFEKRKQMTDQQLFAAFYKEMEQQEPSTDMLRLFEEALDEQLGEEREG